MFSKAHTNHLKNKQLWKAGKSKLKLLYLIREKLNSFDDFHYNWQIFAKRTFPFLIKVFNCVCGYTNSDKYNNVKSNTRGLFISFNFRKIPFKKKLIICSENCFMRFPPNQVEKFEKKNRLIADLTLKRFKLIRELELLDLNLSF
jgi:hypothetical protein